MPTRYDGTSRLVWSRRDGDPDGLARRARDLDASGLGRVDARRSRARRRRPRPGDDGTRRARSSAAGGGSYAQPTVRTLARDSPTALTANASYVRGSPFGAAIGGQVPSAAHSATTWSFERMTNPVSAG